MKGQYQFCRFFCMNMNMKMWWERLEEKPSEKNTVNEFLEERKFTWTPISQPCYQKIGDDYIIIPNHQISVRSDNLKPIAVVKTRYKLLENNKCFSIANEFKKTYPHSKFISCGDIMNDKESYLCMILKKEIICGDEFNLYLTFTNGFDGRNATNATLSLIRSKDHSVFQFSDKNHPRIWTMGRVNVLTKFSDMRNGIENYIMYARDLCENLYEKKIVLNEIVNNIFDINWKKNKKTNQNLAIIKEFTREIYLKNNGASLYDLFFALSNYYCNGKRLRINKLEDDKRFQMAMIKSFYELNNYGEKILKFL